VRKKKKERKNLYFDLDIVCFITVGPVLGCDRFQSLQRLVL